MRRSSSISMAAPSTATTMAASGSATQKPAGPMTELRWPASEKETYTRSIKNEPCAKLTMRVTPKISDSPAATRNCDDAPASPLSSWTRKPEKVMSRARARRSIGRAQLQHLGIGRLELGAVEVDVVCHHALAAV